MTPYDCFVVALLAEATGQRPSGRRRHGKFAVGLALHYFGDGMANRRAGLLRLLLRQARGHTNLKGWLKCPCLVPGANVLHDGPALQTRYKDTVCKRLSW